MKAICIFNVTHQRRIFFKEWNFTKIEERGRDPTGSEHYENLPLTSAECFDSSPTTGDQTEEGPTSLSVESEEEEEDDGKAAKGEEKKERESETTHTTLEAEVARYDSFILFVNKDKSLYTNLGFLILPFLTHFDVSNIFWPTVSLAKNDSSLKPNQHTKLKPNF